MRLIEFAFYCLLFFDVIVCLNSVASFFYYFVLFVW